MPKQATERAIDTPFSKRSSGSGTIVSASGTATSIPVHGLESIYHTGNLDSRYYTESELDAGQLNSLYYTETELNAGQLNSLYYTETELNAGQLNSLYYTETELNAGQLDTRYYTETESDAKYALLATSITGTGALGGGGTLAANRTVTLNTPGALSATSSNSSSTNHTHSIDSTIARSAIDIGVSGLGLSGGGNLTANRTITLASSSNPGAAASLLATSAGGTLTLNNSGSTTTPALVIGDGITGRLAIGSSGWRDNATQLEMLGSRDLWVGSNDVGGTNWSVAGGVVSALAGTDTTHTFGYAKVGSVGHANYAGFAHSSHATIASFALLQSGATGHTILNAASGQYVSHRIANVDVMNMTSSRLNPAGSVLRDLGDYNLKWRTLYAAELYVETLVAQDVISTIGGRIMVAPTTTLIADASSGATTIDVKHNNLVSGDYVYMASAPGGVAQVESMKVTSGATVITGGYRYTVTRNQDSSGANSWVAGDAVADIGGAVGSGYIDLTASSTLHGHLGPTITIYSRTSTATWNGVKPTVSVGNLRSFVDYSSDIFGIAHGNDLTLTPTTGFSGITSDNSNGLRLFNTSLNLYTGGNQFLKLDTTTGFTIKSGTGTSLPTSSIYGAMWYRDTLGGNKAAYIASIYDTTNGTAALRGNNLFVTSYDSPAGPSQLNIIAIDESNAFTDQAQIAMSGGKPTLSMTSNIAMQAKTVTLTTGAKSLVLDQTKAAFNQNIEIGTTLTAGTADTALTSTVQDAILLQHNSALTPANGLGVGVFAKLESSTTANQSAGRLAWKWATVADATRASRLDLSTYYTTTERIGLSLGSNATVPLIGFLGTAPVAKPAAFTQTYATASRTHSNITAVNPAAYAAGANGYSTAAMAAAVHAAVIAHTADIANVKQVVNQLIDDLQAYGLSG